MIIETCPRCGTPLLNTILTSNPPVPCKQCPSCGWSWQGEPEPIEYIPFGGNGCSQEYIDKFYQELYEKGGGRW